MPLIWMFFAVLISSSVLLSTEDINQDQAIRDAEISAMSESMLIYRNLVAAFLDANPAYGGVAPDALLSLPTWYNKPSALNNYITAGTSYVFYSSELRGLAGALASKTESTLVGTNFGGVLSSPNTGNTGILLPAFIPIYAVVIVQ